MRNKEFKQVKGLAQMILDQRSDVETFFLEALEQVKYEYKKREALERKKGVSAVQEVGCGEPVEQAEVWGQS